MQGKFRSYKHKLQISRKRINTLEKNIWECLKNRNNLPRKNLNRIQEEKRAQTVALWEITKN